MLSSALAFLLSNAFFMLRMEETPAGSFPKPLSAAKEREYVSAWLESGDMEARNKLIEHNMRLVAHIVKKYYSPNAEQDDLISIGTVGLIKGVSTYRPDKNVRLATYLSRCIENEVLMYFRSRRKSAGDISLNDTLDDSGDGGIMVMDVLAQEDDMFDRVSSEDLRRRVSDYMHRCLDRREEEIIRLRYGIGGGRALTQRETAEKFGISRSYVSRIEKRALQKLKDIIEQ